MNSPSSRSIEGAEAESEAMPVLGRIWNSECTALVATVEFPGEIEGWEA